MTWELAAVLLAKYSFEIVTAILARMQAGGVVQAQEWADLIALAAKTPASQLQDAIVRNGLDANSPEVKNLLALLCAKGLPL